MAYTGTIATEAELDAMAGENVDVTGWTEANKNLWMSQVEGYLSAVVQYDIVTNWGDLNAVAKTMLTEYAARYCGMCGILYNTFGYTNGLQEAEDMVNVHVFRMEKIEFWLKQGEVLKQLEV